MLRTAVIAYDGSPSARVALNLTAQLLASVRGKLYVAYRIEPSNMVPPPLELWAAAVEDPILTEASPVAVSEGPGESLADARERAAILLRHAVEGLQGSPVSAEPWIDEGDVERWLDRLPAADWMAVGRGPVDRPPGRTVTAVLRMGGPLLLIARECTALPQSFVVIVEDRHGLARVLGAALELAALAPDPLPIKVLCLVPEGDASIAEAAARYLSDHGWGARSRVQTAMQVTEVELAGSSSDASAAWVLMAVPSPGRERQSRSGTLLTRLLGHWPGPVVCVRS